MYKIIGRIAGRVESVHYSNDLDYVNKICNLESIRLPQGNIMNLEAINVDHEEEHKKSYVNLIKECVKYNVCDCKLIPEFE